MVLPDSDRVEHGRRDGRGEVKVRSTVHVRRRGEGEREKGTREGTRVTQAEKMQEDGLTLSTCRGDSVQQVEQA